MSQMIPIFFTFDRHYVVAAGVAFHTLLRKAAPQHRYCLYVAHTDLKERHKRVLRAVVARFANAELHFIDATGLHAPWEGLQHKSHFSKEIFYKLTAASLFPQYDRILFSDVDVVFTADVSEAYSLFEGEDFYYAGARPIQENPSLPRYAAHFTPEEVQTVSQYEVSAGFMLINLAALRRDGQEKRLTDYFRRNLHRLILPEQDCIALCLAPKLRFLDYKYVVCAAQFLLDPDKLRYNPNNLRLAGANGPACFRKMLDECVQLHYPGANKPWNNPFVPLFATWWHACRDAGLVGLYVRQQPLFLWQRLRRYSLRRFIRKCFGHA